MQTIRCILLLTYQWKSMQLQSAGVVLTIPSLGLAQTPCSANSANSMYDHYTNMQVSISSAYTLLIIYAIYAQHTELYDTPAFPVVAALCFEIQYIFQLHESVK